MANATNHPLAVSRPGLARPPFRPVARGVNVSTLGCEKPCNAKAPDASCRPRNQKSQIPVATIFPPPCLCDLPACGASHIPTSRCCLGTTTAVTHRQSAIHLPIVLLAPVVGSFLGIPLMCVCVFPVATPRDRNNAGAMQKNKRQRSNSGLLVKSKAVPRTRRELRVLTSDLETTGGVLAM